MPRLHDLTIPQRERLLETVMRLFLKFCMQELGTTLWCVDGELVYVQDVIGRDWSDPRGHTRASTSAF